MFSEGGHQIAKRIPAGDIVTVESEKLNEDELIEVKWRGKQGMMFSQDIRSKGEKIQAAEA